ncbi:DUF5610 domain-containing protein [Planctomycetota bacterium]
MGSISSGQFGFPSPINRVSGKQSAGLFRKVSENAVPDVPDENQDGLQLNKAKPVQADQAKALFFEVNVNVTRTILNATSDQQDAGRLNFNFQSVEAYYQSSRGATFEGPSLEERLNPLASLQEYFSPENTASRIFDFALSRYGYGRFASPDSSENRADYRDYIFPAIEKGFQEALAAFGELPEEILDAVHNTIAKIQVSFENFVASADAPGSGELPAELLTAG